MGNQIYIKRVLFSFSHLRLMKHLGKKRKNSLDMVCKLEINKFLKQNQTGWSVNLNMTAAWSNDQLGLPETSASIHPWYCWSMSQVWVKWLTETMEFIALIGMFFKVTCMHRYIMQNCVHYHQNCYSHDLRRQTLETLPNELAFSTDASPSVRVAHSHHPIQAAKFRARSTAFIHMSNS